MARERERELVWVGQLGLFNAWNAYMCTKSKGPLVIVDDDRKASK